MYYDKDTNPSIRAVTFKDELEAEDLHKFVAGLKGEEFIACVNTGRFSS